MQVTSNPAEAAGGAGVALFIFHLSESCAPLERVSITAPWQKAR